MHGKSGCFASQNLRFRNAKAQLSLFNRIIFTKSERNFPSVFLYYGRSAGVFAGVSGKPKENH
ncbi:hypothetical protein CTM63_02260 [Prevotella intermedia]|nr:hypothetical protein CTM63_02260 [Prevotella intermedia]